MSLRQTISNSAGVGVNQGTRLNVPQAALAGAIPARQQTTSRPAEFLRCGSNAERFSPPTEAGRGFRLER